MQVADPNPYRGQGPAPISPDLKLSVMINYSPPWLENDNYVINFQGWLAMHPSKCR